MRLAQTNDTAFPLTLTVSSGSGGVTGLAPVVAVRSGSSYLDFADLTFKASGWTTRQQALTEISATNSPGTYEFLLNIAGVVGVTAGALWNLEYQIAGSLDVTDNLAVVRDIYDINDAAVNTVIDAINQQTVILLEACSPETAGLIKAQLVPNVYVGHKGDTLLLPVFRNTTLMPDAELSGATNLQINFKNLDTGAVLQITTGVTIGPPGTGTISYTTVDGDGVFETAGTWEYQAVGDVLSGADFKSQTLRTEVLSNVPLT